MKEILHSSDQFAIDLQAIGLKAVSERAWISETNRFERIDWRDLQHLEEIGDIQNAVWKFGDRNVVPPNILAVVEETGGDLLEAFNLKGEPVAFTLTLATNEPGKQFLHMVGVDPNIQSRNVGLKIMQLEGAIARSKGVDVIEWTYDPLMGGNSNLYLSKLHAIPYKYTINKYGVVKNADTNEESRYKDVPTDRFTVKWNVGDEKVWKLATGEVKVDFFKTPEFWNGEGNPPDSFRVGVPFDFTVLTSEQMMEARQALRKICLRVMDHDDFSNRDFVRGTHVPVIFTPDPEKKTNTYTFFKKAL